MRTNYTPNPQVKALQAIAEAATVIKVRWRTLFAALARLCGVSVFGGA
jgi:hypothetical protein